MPTFVAAMIAVAVAMLVAGPLGDAPARADHAPVIAVPGRPDVPVIINGYDATWAVIEGDWGLYRPGHVAPTVTFAPHGSSARPYGAYYPSAGRPPRYGRFEIEPPPNRPLPKPAESFYRAWSTSSDPALPAEVAPSSPPVIVAPSIQYRRWRAQHRYRRH